MNTNCPKCGSDMVRLDGECANDNPQCPTLYVVCENCDNYGKVTYPAPADVQWNDTGNEED